MGAWEGIFKMKVWLFPPPLNTHGDIAKLNHGALGWEREQKNHHKNKPKHVSFIG